MLTHKGFHTLQAPTIPAHTTPRDTRATAPHARTETTALTPHNT